MIRRLLPAGDPAFGGPGALKVAGCVLMFCRSETWTRVE